MHFAPLSKASIFQECKEPIQKLQVTFTKHHAYMLGSCTSISREVVVKAHCRSKCIPATHS